MFNDWIVWWEALFYKSSITFHSFYKNHVESNVDHFRLSMRWFDPLIFDWTTNKHCRWLQARLVLTQQCSSSKLGWHSCWKMGQCTKYHVRTFESYQSWDSTRCRYQLSYYVYCITNWSKPWNSNNMRSRCLRSMGSHRKYWWRSM